MTVRLDNTLWMKEKTYIRTPSFAEPGLAYTLASTISEMLSANPALPFSLTISSSDSTLCGIWKVSKDLPNHSLVARFFQWFPFTKEYLDRSITHLVATKEQSIERASQVIYRPTPCIKLKQNLLHQESFQDPFTELATENLQTYELNFVSEQNVVASYRFVIENDMVSIRRITENDDPEENRKVVEVYREYILKEFGSRYLDYVNTAYGFSLDTLIEQGEPLTPDHVFKVNIGMCNIELYDLQLLYEKLVDLKASVDQAKKFPETLSLTMREYRALVSYLKTDDKRAIYTLLKKFPQDKRSVQDLDLELFSLLVEFVFPTDAEIARAFTGRKIQHIAVVGSNTMGAPNIYNPSRDLFELMHLYSDMRKADNWDNYKELAAHVMVKKTLFRQAEYADGYHAGIILPAPDSLDGKRRWYCNTHVFNDGHGSINYVFEPANKNETTLPYIKCYRSTATTANAFDWLDSIRADLNPYGSPESLEEKDVFAKEHKEIKLRTIPLWVAHFMRAEKERLLSHAKNGLLEYIKCLEAPSAISKDRVETAIQEAKNALTLDFEGLKGFLQNKAYLHNEHPKQKISQDVIFAGHSLGGSLAQWAMQHFCAKNRRIPLPTKNFICYSSRGPGINSDQERRLMQYGKEHAALIESLGQRWQILHSFSAGDFLPQAGHRHLGVTCDDDCGKWVKIKNTVLKPLESATALEITTHEAHERRREQAQEGIDFESHELTVQDLYQYDCAWIMPRRLIKIFDYKICISSKVVEFGREFFAALLSPLLTVIEKVHTFFHPKIITRNDFGGFVLNARRFGVQDAVALR